MNGIANEKCFVHRRREAVALCLECRRFFCRECITVHDDRAVCASCLRKLARAPGAGGKTAAGLGALVKIVAGLVVLWLVFFSFGLLLLRIPSSVHEGSLWEESPRENLRGTD